jgi:alkylation response protein AidB-like acyl-CoA dehydrogenase
VRLRLSLPWSSRTELKGISVVAESSYRALSDLCERLANAASDLDQSGIGLREQLRWLAEANVFRWFVPREFGGWEWSEEEILDGYLQLSQSCLTTAFMLTQWNAACKRIVNSQNQGLKNRLLPHLATGETIATVGISHLTTSRQHVGSPAVAATKNSMGGFVLNGYSPWVTGGALADAIVIGASLDDGQQILGVVPTSRLGLVTHPGAHLVALSASCTDRVDLQDVTIQDDELLAGPQENVLGTKSSSSAGGLPTSTLAIGLSKSAAAYLRAESLKRPELTPIAAKVEADCASLERELRHATLGSESMNTGELRQRANSLVLRSTQAALQAAKGAGFIATHPTGRWAREAMFFLVWSCPQAVAYANMCELAQIES